MRVKKLWQQTKVPRKKKRKSFFSDEKAKTKQLISLAIQPKETNQKILTKEERIKRYQDRVKQNKHNRTLKNKTRKFY